MYKAMSILSSFVRCYDTNNNTCNKSGKYEFPIVDPSNRIMLMNIVDNDRSLKEVHFFCLLLQADRACF